MSVNNDNICMIYKSTHNSKVDTKRYNKRVTEFAKYLAQEKKKGKFPLIITGSGISDKVPKMSEMMEKLTELVQAKVNNMNEYSDVFQKIFSEYKETIVSKNNSDYEIHLQQSRLLTYIQNVYLNKNQYIQKKDKNLLDKVWSDFIIWLLKGENGKSGIINATPSQIHKQIVQFYKETSAVSITTNFDNLLEKAFCNASTDNFSPILEKEAFNDYYTSVIDSDSYVEIQSRGDVFWVTCTGKNNRVCPNIKKRCFIPGKYVKTNDEITCELCKSPAEVYFAFPGTKEKDAEMAQVMDGVWKFLAYRVSSVIIIGSSMNYDPVLLNFVKELTERRNIYVLYISPYNEENNCTGNINKNAATKYLFRNSKNMLNIWAIADKTQNILSDILKMFKNYKQLPELCTQSKEQYEKWIEACIGETNKEAFYNTIAEIKKSDYELNFIEDTTVHKMNNYSQLGLKTYWLDGNNKKNNCDNYNLHNRYRHSVGVMLIASYIYLGLKGYQKKPITNELKFLQLAAFFHDIGHLPFSHLLEEIFQEFGWISAGETKTFNHEQHTKSMIKNIFNSNSYFEQTLQTTGYTLEDLLKLINGEFGVGYLDALINSPLDCDKMEYLFSDAVYTGRGSREDLTLFLNSFSEDLTISNSFLVMSGESTKSFLQLLEMRGRMYEEVYLRSGLRYLEACCKLIIKTFIVYKCTDENLFKEVKPNEELRFHNLSEAKIAYIIEWFNHMLIKYESEIHEEPFYKKDLCEIYILDKMKDYISSNTIISNEIKNAVCKCYDEVYQTKGKNMVKEIEKNKVKSITLDLSNKRFNKEKLNNLMKDVYLRFPGILMVDCVQSKAAFSFGGTGLREKRLDGTSSSIESILIKDIQFNSQNGHEKYKCLGDALNEINDKLNFPNRMHINLYKISDDSYRYMQAEDFVINQLRTEGVIPYESL